MPETTLPHPEMQAGTVVPPPVSSPAPVSNPAPTGEALASQQTPPVAASEGFFSRLWKGTKNMFSKTADIAGKTMQNGASILGNIAQTAASASATMTQGVGQAIEQNQGGSVAQNVVGAVKDLGSTTVAAATQTGAGIVQAGKDTFTGATTTGKEVVQTVITETPLEGTFVQNLAEKANEVGTQAVQQVSSLVQEVQQKDPGVQAGEIQTPVVETAATPAPVSVNSAPAPELEQASVTAQLPEQEAISSTVETVATLHETNKEETPSGASLSSSELPPATAPVAEAVNLDSLVPPIAPTQPTNIPNASTPTSVA